MERKQFGENLKVSRKRAGLTQQQLGDLAGVGQVVIANYERGARFPGEDILRKLAEVLHVSLDFLLSVSREKILPLSDENYSADTLLEILEDQPVGSAWNYIHSWKEKQSLYAEDVYRQILIPLLLRTGDLWFAGKFSVMDEHLVSGKIRELITLTAADEEGWGDLPDPGKKWMGLCAPGEKHDLVLLMTASLLQLKGWNVRFLGTDMPAADLIRSIDSFKPQVLCLSVTINSFREGLDTYLNVLYRERKEEYAVILGGAAILPDDMDKFPGVWGIADDLARGVALAEEYVK